MSALQQRQFLTGALGVNVRRRNRVADPGQVTTGDAARDALLGQLKALNGRIGKIEALARPAGSYLGRKSGEASQAVWAGQAQAPVLTAAVNALAAEVTQAEQALARYPQALKCIAQVEATPAGGLTRGQFDLKRAEIDTYLGDGNFGPVANGINELLALWPAAMAGARGRQIDATLGKSFELAAKAALPAGEGARLKAKLDPKGQDADFAMACNTVSVAEKSRDPKQFKAVETICRDYVREVERRPEKEREAAQERVKYLKSVITQARLGVMAADYQALGPIDLWDPVAEAKATAIQAAYFFEEATVHAKDGEVGAEPSSTAGVNGSWWVKRDDPVAADKKARSKYIFKPGDAENIALGGFAKGSGAPREVFAKVINDELMAAAGFDAGVCPTVLAEIDSVKLPDARGRTAPVATRLGSMQQLADNKGSAKDLGNAGDPILAKIPQENFDQIAVFDVMTNALDRHAGNLLVAEGPDGTPGMIPIDHGYSLPNKRQLLLNRRRMLPPQNALLDAELFPGGQADRPLSPSVVEGLQRLNPARMAQNVKAARDALRQAHPAMNDGTDDEALDVLERSAAFAQQASPLGVSARDLFEISARHAPAIQNTAVNQMGALAATLVARHRADQAAAAELKQRYPTSDGLKAALVELGWSHGHEYTTFDTWVGDNMGRVAKIVKGRLVNPALPALINALTQRVGQMPEYQTLRPKLAGLAPLDRVKELEKLETRLINRSNADLTDADMNALTQIYNGLGGDAAWDQVYTFSPQGDVLLEGDTPDNHLRIKVKALRAWRDFLAEGGPDEYTRRGMPLKDVVPSVLTCLLELRQAKAQEAGDQAVDQMTDQDVVNDILGRARYAYAQVTRAKTRDYFTGRANAIRAQAAAGQADAARAAAFALQADAEAFLPTFREAAPKLQAAEASPLRGTRQGAALAKALRAVTEALDRGDGPAAQAAFPALDQLLA